jgi:hypothetical protein
VTDDLRARISERAGDVIVLGAVALDKVRDRPKRSSVPDPLPA